MYIVDGKTILNDIITILNSTLYHDSLDTAVKLAQFNSYMVLTVQSFIILLLLRMQRRSVLEYLVSQTIMVITYIRVM